ncbi:hypothetical protein MRB53_009004 [Persea americana]|uniref:Uncharacterized protein n=1 Tax=Persea americana TaxID=3435 RepID=A0ACC2LMR1_PERAE|nr:hypothetical protein MRB53_009004 [Persea americana]
MLEGEEQQNAQNVPWQMNNNNLEREIPSSKHRSNNNRGASSSHNGHNQSLSGRKNSYHRHTQSQINALEALFKECPHPDDKQRRELAQQLSLEPLQVKFWFQNKRTQMKNHNDRYESTNLRTENELLRMENMRYKEALSSMMCHTCSGPITIGETTYNEEQLRLENTRLREEIQRISATSKNVGKQMLPECSRAPLVPSHASLEPPTGSSGVQVGMSAEMYEAAEILQSMPGQPDPDKKMIVEIVVVAMDELVRMATLGQPLWTPAYDGSTETICYEEYVRTFTRGTGLRRFGMTSEVTRETVVLAMNHIKLVEILMNVNQWASVFSTIISKAVIMDVLVASDGGNYNGALQVMLAEFQVPSPLVPVQESYFARFCKQHGDGTWVVVDVSLDNVHPGPSESYRRRPSGCVIQEMPNDYSKVTWVEHVEVDHKKVHQMYKPIAGLGLLFGAKRWVATLDHQCERLALVMAGGNLGGDGGRRPTLEALEQWVISSWRLSRPCLMSLTEKGQDESIWPSETPVWIRLRGIPYHYWSSDILLSIATSIGKPLCLDDTIAKQRMLSFARVQVLWMWPNLVRDSSNLN